MTETKKQKPANTTSITVYIQQGDCKKYPNQTNCVLLQKLYDLHKKHNLPYKMKHSRIFYPISYYDSVNGVYLDIENIAKKVCQDCIQKTK